MNKGKVLKKKKDLVLDNTYVLLALFTVIFVRLSHQSCERSTTTNDVN